MNKLNKIPIAKPSLPSIRRYVNGIEKIWQNRMLSNFNNNAEKLELIIKNKLQAKHVAVVSGADIGLIISLTSLDLPVGSKIIVPSYTFNSTANCVLWNNLEPVFADIDRETLTVDPKDIIKKVDRKTKAIIATNTFGNPCKIAELIKISRKYNLHLIFDSAASYGSIYKNKYVGNLGDIEVFSFSGTKIVSSAEGGVIVAKNPKVIEKIKHIRNYGFLNDYNSKYKGLNGKISEFNALLGTLTLPNIDKWITKRNKFAQIYIKNLKGVKNISFQKVEIDNISTYNDFVILTPERDRLQKYLTKNRIQTKTYFSPIHKMDLYKKYYTNLVNTDFVYNNCLTLPMYNDMKHVDQMKVIKKIKNFYINENK